MKKIITLTAITLIVLLSLQIFPIQVHASETVVYSEGFENSNGGYTSAGTVDQWEWGTPTNPNGPGSAHSGAKCWATNLTSDVPSVNSTSYLTSPPIILPSAATNQVLRVRFYAWIAVDEGYERGEFQVSSDGTSFVSLVELFHRMQGNWSAYDFDITNYAGGSIYLRFLLYTDDLYYFQQSPENMAGLYIDDVKITLYVSPADKTTLTLQAYEEQAAVASCPWVFPWNGSDFVQDNDIYPTARGINREYTDYYKLNSPLVPVDGKYLLDLKEIIEETSYTDLVRLVAVDHNATTKVAPDENGNIWTYSNPAAPASAIDGKGSNVSIQMANEDNLVYKGYNCDTVTLNFSNVDTSNDATLVLQAAGFKDDGNLGTPISASPRIFIQTQDAFHNWISRHFFYPRNNPSTQAFDLTSYLTGNKLVRLYITSCYTGKYFAIDYVGLDNNAQANVTIHSMSPISATHSINGDILSKIVNSDNEYASMGPGETMSLAFAVPGIVNEARDFVLITRGYYLPSGTYFISTWDGTSWVERDGWSILSAGDQNHTFDMSLFLPDPNGQFKVRIWQDFWASSAGINYVGLIHVGQPATMTSALDLKKNLTVTSLLNASDNSRDEWLLDDSGYPYNRTRNRWVEITFTAPGQPSSPPTTNPIIVTNLTSATPTISWTFADNGYDVQTMYEVEVWTFSAGTGNVMWDPVPGTGIAQSVVYAGLALTVGQTYYARVKVFDGKDWGQWSETAFYLSPPYSLTVNTAGSGSVTRAPDQASYASGTVVTLTAVPAAGWSFSGWSGDLIGITNPTTITMIGGKTVTATFTPISPVVLFADGFESGNFGAWSGVSGSPVVQTATKHDGNYAMRAAASGRSCYLTVSVSEIDVRAYFYLDASVGDVQLMRFRAGSNNIAIVTRLSSGVLRLTYRNGGSTQSVTSAVTMSLDAWHCLEIQTVIGSSGEYSVWLDGVEISVFHLTGRDNNNYGSITRVDVGCVSSTSSTVDVYVDCAVRSSGYIGPEYSLSVANVGSGNVVKNPDKTSYLRGDVVQLTAVPASGDWTFSGWSGTFSSSVNPVSVIINGSTSATATFSARANAYLVVRGSNNLIYYRGYSLTSSSWSEWNTLPGSTPNSPAAAKIGNELHVVVRGTNDGLLWYGYVDLTSDTFSGWTLLGGATPSTPTLTRNSTHLCLVVRGNNNVIYYRFYEVASRAWSGWIGVPNGATLDTPAATLVGNALQVVVRGSNYDQIWHGTVNLADNTVSDWTLLSGSTPSQPSLTSNSTSLCLVVRGGNNNIYYRWYNLTSETWTDWTGFPYGTTPDTPAATITDNNLQIVVRGTTGDQIWHGTLALANDIWSGWKLLDGATPTKPVLTS